MSALNVPIRIKRGDGLPAQLRQGELAFDQTAVKLYIGSGTEVNGFAPNVVELTTPPTVLADLADISVGSGASDGDVLVYDSATSEWVAEALSIAWDSVTSKPASFAPSTHASSHHTGGGDAIAPADIGAAAATHSHAWGDITSGVPSSFTPSAHKASHATGGADALSPSDIGALASSLKGANNGVAELDGSGKLPTSQLPNLAVSDYLGEVANEAAMLALNGQKGDWASRTDSGAVWIITGDTPSSIGSWTQLSYPAAPVASVNGETGTVVLDHTDVGAAASSHTHSDATTSVAGFLSASDKTKLNGIASGAEVNVQSDWNASSGDAQILNKPSLATVATTGAYSDLSGTPTIGTAAASATGDFAAASHNHAAADINSGTLEIARIPTGSTSSTVCIGNDARLSDSRTPTSHTHGNITNAGAIGSTSGLPVKTGASGVLEAGAFGTSAGQFAEGDHTHAWTDITSKPSDFTPTAHSHTVTLEISGFIESPEAKTYVLSPAIPAAITITQLKAQTSAGTVDLAVHDDGTLVTGCSLADAGTTLASLASSISESVAAGSKLALVVSDPQSSPADLSFTVHYTVMSANNA